MSAHPPLRARWVVAAKSAYAVTHVLPLAHAYRRRYGEPLPLWSDDARASLPNDLVRFVGAWHALRPGTRVLCLDIPTLIRFGLIGRRCAFLYHALISKGALHRGGRPHAALRLARDLLFPEPEQFAPFPERWRARCRACGHLPEDWAALPAALLPADAQRALARWRAAPTPRVLLLATRGALSAWEDLRAALVDPPAGFSIGVKRHPALAHASLPDGVLDLAGVPVPLLADAADLVVGDHSSATLEAVRRGRPVAVVETKALRALRAAAPALDEWAYLGKVRRLDSSDALRALLADPSTRPAERDPVAAPGRTADRVLDLLAHIA